MADPGTIFLFKSASTLIVAVVQRVFVGKSFSVDQWRAMALQACGMIVVQYDPCRSRPIHRPLAYACVTVSAVVTGISTVRNEYLVKNYKIGLNVQNMTLYTGGVWMNLLAFLVIPNPNSKQAVLGFFEGYDNPLALAVVFANAMIGLAINAVYKYADAITKCIASDITAVLLCILSQIFFGLEASVLTWCGVAVVCLAVHLYTSAPRTAPTSNGASNGSSSAPTNGCCTKETTLNGNNATHRSSYLAWALIVPVAASMAVWHLRSRTVAVGGGLSTEVVPNSAFAQLVEFGARDAAACMSDLLREAEASAQQAGASAVANSTAAALQRCVSQLRLE